MTQLPPSSSSSRGGSRPAAPVATPPPAMFIGRYQVLERIGEGGMGSLFLARDPAIDRLVAIKILRRGLDTEPLRERFAREARAAGRLRHPNIVTIFDVGDHEGDPFIAMEFLPGETLAELIRDGARLSLPRRLKLVEELCDGLAYAHRAGLVHRDIKPANLMVDAEGVLKILDFGIVRLGDSGMTQAGVLVGTVNYMSPEQVLGSAIDHRSDIFAVGLVAYELLSGRQAFAGALKEGLLNRILNVSLEPLGSVVSGLDPDVIAIVEQALKKDPADRYQDLARMRNDLARVRQRLELIEERLASEAVANAGETAVIALEQTSPGINLAAPAPSAPDILEHAERALAEGNYRAALTMAGRSAALNPADRSASGIVARAEAGLLDRGRAIESSGAAARPPTGTPPATPLPGTPASSPAGTAATQASGSRANIVAVVVAALALLVAAVALWPRLRQENAQPQTPPSQSDVATRPADGGASQRGPDRPAPPTAPPSTAVNPVPASPGQPAAGSPAQSESQAPAETSAPTPEPLARSARGAESTSKPGTRPPSASEQRRTAARGAAPPSPPASEPPAEPPATAKPAETRLPSSSPLRVGSGVPRPRRTHYEEPVYPAAAKADGIAGTVTIEITIGRDGHVTDTRILRSVPGLDDAAVAAVRKWEYSPTRIDGEPIAVVDTVDVPFAPQDIARTPATALPGSTVPRPTAPSSSPAPRATPAAPAADPRAEIREALRRYEAAWEALDADALARVQMLSPSALATVRNSMQTASSYQLTVDVQDITVDAPGRSATARCTISRRYSPKVGRPEARTGPATVQLERRGDAWVIVNIR